MQSLSDMINTRLGDLLDPFIDPRTKQDWAQSLEGKYYRSSDRFWFPRDEYGYEGGTVRFIGSDYWNMLDEGKLGEGVKEEVYNDLNMCSDKLGKRGYWRCLYHNIDNSYVAMDTDDYSTLVSEVRHCKDQSRLASWGGRKNYIHQLDDCIDRQIRGHNSASTDPDNEYYDEEEVKKYASRVNRLEGVHEGTYGVDFAKVANNMYQRDLDIEAKTGKLASSPFLGLSASELKFQQYFQGYDQSTEESIAASQKDDLTSYAAQAMPSFAELAYQEGSTGFENVFGEENEMYKQLYATGASKLGTETVLDILGERGRWAEDFYNTVAELAEMDQFTT